MRRHRLATRRVSRGGDLTRVSSMIMMLLVLGALIRYAGNAETWRWVENNSNAWAGDDADKGSPAKPAPAKPAPPPSAQPVAGGPPEAGGPTEAGGLTDEDPDEADAAREEFQAVGDRTLVIQPEEMLAYNRVLGWVRNQSFEALLKRAKRKVVYNDFLQTPDKFRGKLVALDLTVLRALKIDDKPEGDSIYENLYELWGVTSESGNWPYEAMVVDLPKGMPLGPQIWEKVRVVGYFFKLQAYQRAGAKVNEPPQVAPILIGRLSWKEAAIPRVQSADWLWGGMVAVLFGIVTVVAVVIGLVLRRRPRVIQSVGIGTSGLTTDEWLDRAEAGVAPIDETDLEDFEDSQSQLAGGEGHGDVTGPPLNTEPDDNLPRDR